MLSGACAGVEVVRLLVDAKAALGVMSKVLPDFSARGLNSAANETLGGDPYILWALLQSL